MRVIIKLMLIEACYYGPLLSSCLYSCCHEMEKNMKLVNKLRTFYAGKKIFAVPYLKRLTLAENLKHCQSRFRRRYVRKATMVEKLRFIVTH